MGREEAREKGWNTWRKNLMQYAEEHPEYSLEEYVLKRADTAQACWRQARLAERSREYKKARGLYLKATESLEQVEKLMEHPLLPGLLEKLKSEYYDFVVHRDPIYRSLIKQPLLWIKDNPGIIQTELYKLFPDHSREDMTFALYFAAKEGLIRREEKGRSYQLFFEREKADDEPLLKIQDDEIDLQEKAEQEAAMKSGCIIFVVIIIWLLAFGAAYAFAGLVGVAVVAAAFIVWLVIRKIRRKKQEPPKEAPSAEAAPPPELPDNSEKNDEVKPV